MNVKCKVNLAVNCAVEQDAFPQQWAEGVLISSWRDSGQSQAFSYEADL